MNIFGFGGKSWGGKGDKKRLYRVTVTPKDYFIVAAMGYANSEDEAIEAFMQHFWDETCREHLSLKAEEVEGDEE
jgi:hypothetical protein